LVLFTKYNKNDEIKEHEKGGRVEFVGEMFVQSSGIKASRKVTTRKT
jgi:hypothetical protein